MAAKSQGRKMPTDQDLLQLACTLGSRLGDRPHRLATAESLTGGWIAKVCTDVAGSSRWFDRAFVTYSVEAKISMLGVPPELITEHGVVSEAVAAAMAAGALARSEADIALAVTGVAGPSGGSDDTPVGTVCFAWAVPTQVDRRPRSRSETCRFVGAREQIRRHTVQHAIAQLLTGSCLLDV